KYLLGAIFIVLFFSRVIRPIMGWMTTTVEVMPQEGQLSADELAASEEERKRLEGATEAADVQKTISDFVENDPKLTAGIVRRWMKEKTPTGA
ncbi:uncharacterized protein METZ01_LOCUS366331, partial [marine metagenome]